jgi:hypothetical protein
VDAKQKRARKRWFCKTMAQTFFLYLVLSLSTVVSAWHVTHYSSNSKLKTGSSLRMHGGENHVDNMNDDTVFDDFCRFLRVKQSEIIAQLEQMDGSDSKFSNDCWGMFVTETNTATAAPTTKSGGITRVLQGGHVIEKGACSLTVIQQGTLSQEPSPGDQVTAGRIFP